MEIIIIQAGLGEDLEIVLERALDIADKKMCIVEFEFWEIIVSVKAGDDFIQKYEEWRRAVHSKNGNVEEGSKYIPKRKFFTSEKSLQFILTFDFINKKNDKKFLFKKIKNNSGNYSLIIKLRYISFTILNFDCISELAKRCD